MTATEAMRNKRMFGALQGHLLASECARTNCITSVYPSHPCTMLQLLWMLMSLCRHSNFISACTAPVREQRSSTQRRSRLELRPTVQEAEQAAGRIRNCRAAATA